MNQFSPPPLPAEQNKPALGEAISEQASKLKDTLKDEAAETGQKIKAETKAAAGHLKDAGKRYAVTQKDVLSEKVSEFSQALNSASDKLKEGGEPNLLAGPAETLAGRLGELSQFLKDSDPRAILQGIERIAHRKPELFFGGLFLAGLVGTRFLKASGSRARAAGRSNQQLATVPGAISQQ